MVFDFKGIDLIPNIPPSNCNTIDAAAAAAAAAVAANFIGNDSIVEIIGIKIDEIFISDGFARALTRHSQMAQSPSALNALEMIIIIISGKTVK